MPKRYRRFFRRRGGFIPGARLRRARTEEKRRRGLSSRTSDFYARSLSRPRLSVPTLWKPGTMRRLSTSTQTAMQRILNTRKKVSTKTDKSEKERGTRIINMVRRLRRPTRIGKPKTQMEYTRTLSEGNSTSYFTRKALRIRGMKKRIMRSNPIRLRMSEIVSDVNWLYGKQGVTVLIHNTNSELDSITDVATSNPTAKMLIQSTKIHYLITSGTTAGVKMRIYEGCYKSDAESTYTPAAVWNSGLADTGTTMVNSDIDAKPWASPAFNNLCHVTKVTNVYLPQGRTHEHYATYNYNKLYNKETYQTSSGRELLRGWTRFIMFVCYGEPIADTDTDVSTAGGRVLIIGTKTQRWRYSVPEQYTAAYTRTIPITGVTTERIIDEGSGAIETVVKL